MRRRGIIRQHLSPRCDENSCANQHDRNGGRSDREGSPGHHRGGRRHTEDLLHHAGKAPPSFICECHRLGGVFDYLEAREAVAVTRNQTFSESAFTALAIEELKSPTAQTTRPPFHCC